MPKSRHRKNQKQRSQIRTNKLKADIKKYQEVMRQLEQEYAERREVVSSDKKKRVKQIVEEHGDDPQRLAEMVEETFGFEINND